MVFVQMFNRFCFWHRGGGAGGPRAGQRPGRDFGMVDFIHEQTGAHPWRLPTSAPAMLSAQPHPSVRRRHPIRTSAISMLTSAARPEPTPQERPLEPPLEVVVGVTTLSVADAVKAPLVAVTA